MERRRFKAGEVITRENDVGETAFVIEKGRVAISKKMGDQEIALATLGPGDPVGEMSMIDDKLRSATATALENVEAREIHQDELFESLQTDPEVGLRLLKALFERLREADATILQLQASGKKLPESAESAPPSVAVVLEGVTGEAEAALPQASFRIDSFPFRIGRHSHNPLVHNDLPLADSTPWQISRHHVTLVARDGKVGVIDRGSHLGGALDGHRFGGDTGEPGPLFVEGGEAELLLGSESSPFRFRLTVGG